jgi:alginate O-acetyltransferase complex protein AlgF
MPVLAEVTCAPVNLKSPGWRFKVEELVLAAQCSCDGKPRGASVDLGQLQAGQRYSLLLVPAGAGASKLIFTTDAIAR